MKTVSVRIAAAVALALAGVQAGFAAEGEELEEVQVTGSRITLAPGMSTPTPVTSVLAEEMESLGPNQIIDSLNALPVFRNNSTPTSRWAARTRAAPTSTCTASVPTAR
ncbi:MAG: hypothetical protein IPG49_16310 [Proteobacteria bacterium]|nr:hypothetical protein [Pseudomonadota bacterium]